MARRREVLRWSLAGALGLALPGATAALASQRTGTRVRAAGPTPVPTASPSAAPPPDAFTVPLPIPQVLRPTSSAGGVDSYEIRQMEGSQRILPGLDTPVWGYQGTFPGPTIEARAGREVRVTHHNLLPAPTVVHLHGAVVAPEHDGYPSDFVLPAEGDWASDPSVASHAAHTVAGLAEGSRTYVYPNQQAGATLWYHDHRMSFSGPQQYRGLAGFYLLRDDLEDRLPLPRGARELPLMIADREIEEDGSLYYPGDPELRQPGVVVEYHHSGMLGSTIAVNGVAWPYCEVDGALYRLRVVNASNARRYTLAMDPAPPGGAGLIQIGSDLGLLPAPVRHRSISIAPGERYDLLVDFSAYPPGTSVVLRNLLADGPPGYIMRFDVGAAVPDDARVPETLAPEPDLPDFTSRPADRRFSFFSGPEMTGLPALINLLPFDGARIDAQPAFNSTEVWDITADPDHPVHVHLGHFRVLRRDGGPPLPQDLGLKDTIFVPEGGVRVAVTFAGYRGKYVFHCHNLEHADAGMMTNLEVV